MTKQKEVLMFSGGTDSLIAWFFLGKPEILHVNVGTRYSNSEFIAVARFAMDHDIEAHFFNMAELANFEEHDANISGRNLYLAMVACNMGYSNIWMVFQKDETSIPDRTKKFCEDAGKLLSFLYGRTITINSPFWDMDKEEMVRWYLDQKLPVKHLKSAFSCYNSTGHIPCGDCPACFRKFVALSLNGVQEQWFKKLKGSHTAEEYRKKALGGHYSKERNEKTLRALKFLEDL